MVFLAFLRVGENIVGLHLESLYFICNLVSRGKEEELKIFFKRSGNGWRLGFFHSKKYLLHLLDLLMKLWLRLRRDRKKDSPEYSFFSRFFL